MTTIDSVPHQIPPLEQKSDESHGAPDPSFAGARFLGNPTAPLDIEDWLEEMR